MTPQTFQRMAADPWEFAGVLYVPTADRGPQPLADVLADFQRAWLVALVPSLVALCRGEKPPITRFWIEATKGAGKDWVISVAYLWLLVFCPRGLLSQVGAADQEQANELRKSIRSILQLDQNAWLRPFVEVQTSLILNPATDFRIEILTNDSNSAHGARPDGVLFLNEITHLADFRRPFAETLFDNASKCPFGLAIIATNPGFAGSWQEEWRNLAIDSPRWFFSAYSQPAPWLDPDELAEARKRNSKTRYLRLWEGVWVAATGDCLDPDDIEAAILKPTAPHLPQPGPMIGSEAGYEFTAAVDLGIRHDHSAIVCVGAHGKTQRVRLASCRSFAPPRGGEVDLAEVEAEIIAVHRRFRPARIMFDPFQCVSIAQRLTKAGLPMQEMTFSGSNLNRMASALLDAFRSRRIDLYRDESLVRDLQRLTIVEKQYGYKLESTRDANGHADRATALAMTLPFALAAASSGAGQPLMLHMPINGPTLIPGPGLNRRGRLIGAGPFGF